MFHTVSTIPKANSPSGMPTEIESGENLYSAANRPKTASFQGTSTQRPTDSITEATIGLPSWFISAAMNATVVTTSPTPNVRIAKNQSSWWVVYEVENQCGE